MRFVDNSGGAKILCLALTAEQLSFLMYHLNSYANNSVMLASPKPMIMRDLFLIKSDAMVPNPLSFLYQLSGPATVIDLTTVWFIALPVTTIIGCRHAFGLLFGGGIFSGFAYLFQSQLSFTKNNTKFDCNCTSHGALAALYAQSYVLPNCILSLSKNRPCSTLTSAYIAYLAVDEFVLPKLYRRQGVIEVHNWGFIGGVFWSFIYSTLFLRTKTDFNMMRRFYKNIVSKSS